MYTITLNPPLRYMSAIYYSIYVLYILLYIKLYYILLKSIGYTIYYKQYLCMI